jgi:uncharacterized protein (TIGR02001 family)
MKLSTPYAVLIALLSTGLPAAAAPLPEMAVRLDLIYASRYVYRGVELARDSLQPSLDVSANGTYAGAWLNGPLASGQKNEMNYYFGHEFAGDTLLDEGGIIDLGGRVYHFPRGHYVPGTDATSYEAYVGLKSGPLEGGITPAIYSYYDFTRRSYNFHGSLSTVLPVAQLGFGVRVSAHVGHTGFTRSALGTDYTYWGAAVSLPYAITPNAALTLGAQYDSNNLAGAKRDLVSFTAGVSMSF